MSENVISSPEPLQVLTVDQISSQEEGLIPLLEVDNEKSNSHGLRHYCPLLYTPSLLGILIAFLLSGVSQPLLIMEIKYNGACQSSTFLFLYPNYVGMSFLMLMPKPQYEMDIPYKFLVGTILLDCVGQGLCYLGMVLAGSSIYTVIYASVTIFTAVFSYFLLHRKLMLAQWVACSIVTFGVALSSIDASGQGSSVFAGVLCLIVGSCVHALTYICMESILTRERPLSPERLAGYMGVGGVIVYSFWMACWTLPKYQSLIVDKVNEKHGELGPILVSYAALLVANWLHAWTFYNVLGLIGSVTAGIIKGLQAVSVFVASHIFFCHHDDKQCFGPMKGVSLAVVVSGVFLYSVGASQQPKGRQTKQPVASEDEFGSGSDE